MISLGTQMANFGPIASNFGQLIIKIQKELVEKQIFLISALDYYNIKSVFLQ